ncbi:bile acid beta-glucosidase [Phormidesmis priestleyi ULC007]|uniref:Bile acid beta-glucosidase n=1 Tax=Phormidesmis priestleyi ULC007 TaxID=1920490 RepID=A0A2T1DG31_9CYAN|nr:GH116 family glycosyl hydrolase [Phormidesmis priestleyi]PSB19436.1 bile acid beta-glucosidase [Phormidesmis priestleyi ULC007]PZO53123.1 MAG: bile acid beta-glucosidase [Phormidesmis priestleyi]
MKRQQPSVNIPASAWSRSIGRGWEKPYTVRYASNLDDGPWHGMPLGGFGAGCIGRSSRGDFNLWHIDGGEHVFQTIPGCQFSVFEQLGTQTQAYALSTEAANGSLSTWNWYPASQEGQSTGTYSALYPRSWFVYENVLKANLTCEQFSPIVADNYQETSYPIAIFEWTAHNPTDQPITLSVMLTWENMTGWFTNSLKSPNVQMRDDGSSFYDYQPRMGESTGNFNTLTGDEQRIGVVMGSDAEEPLEGEGQWAIATLLNSYLWEVFYDTRWNPSGDGSEVWRSFAKDGSLCDRDDETPAKAGEQIGSAIAVRFTLKPGQTLKIPFILSWDFPVTEFAAGVNYFRRYTDFFGRTGRNAWTIARTALKHYRTWHEKILTWQQPIVDRDDLPDWFKMALFNELYILTDGGSLWSAADERDPVGQFAVLECLDYRWYESLDVRLYGSFGLLMLWSKLEKSVIRAFARSIPTSDERTRVIGYYYTLSAERNCEATGAESQMAIRKVAGATPHDLGAPNEHVWEKTNYTSYQDCNLWKDLGADFVLQVYRDYVLTGANDIEFLIECWDAIVETLHYLKTFDLDNDGIPENSGAPDQTFDDWRLQGVSAYCGGLWIAALEAAIAISQILITNHDSSSIHESVAMFQTWLDQSRAIYQETLWNGQYYRLDSQSGSDVVMVDQLCGQFYARLLGLPDVVPQECAESALKTVYDACFVKFNQFVRNQGSEIQNCSIGAANGVRPDGSPENPNATHPLEVWTGINFGLAAFLVQMGMTAEAMTLTEAVVRQIYDNGLQFRTPEAITATATFRASHYLRAMAIWAIYGTLSDR